MTEVVAATAATGEELLAYILRGPGRNLHLERGRKCIKCGKDCSRVALVSLAYVFEVCDCHNPPYEHLVESLMHRDCLKGTS